MPTRRLRGLVGLAGSEAAPERTTALHALRLAHPHRLAGIAERVTRLGSRHPKPGLKRAQSAESVGSPPDGVDGTWASAVAWSDIRPNRPGSGRAAGHRARTRSRRDATNVRAPSACARDRWGLRIHPLPLSRRTSYTASQQKTRSCTTSLFLSFVEQPANRATWTFLHLANLFLSP